VTEDARLRDAVPTTDDVPALQEAIDALRAGTPVIIPTDTVYGLVAHAEVAAATERLYALKGRDPGQPSALLVAEIETLLACVPELRGRSEAIVRALLPGPYTLILPNPGLRYSWLAGSRPRAIGVRVPDLPPGAAHVVRSVGAVV
jgi:L-threonylcarbamoyladenylate synthase